MTSSRTVSRLSRILALIPYVLEKESAEVADVLERFGYSKSQLTRDINTVFVCGLPGYGPGDLMEAYIDEDEVIIDAADYFTRAPRLTPTEALGLLASGMTVIGMGEGTPALESAVRKLTEAAIPDADSSLSVDVLDETDTVGVLRDAAADGKVVRIVYRSVGKEETTTREVEPWSVFATLGKWYVMGHCRLVDDERTFRVDRIKEMEVLEEGFERPREIPDPVVGYTASESDVTCLIDLGPQAKWVLEYYPVDVIKDGDEVTRVRFAAPDAEVPARLLLRLGADATLVEGKEVASRLTALGNELLAMYG
ncbi:MAG: WYL domain-containing protein [Actinomycetota bacterium]|nr:WYL domain-containing protein [Actinomycetota bacterium]